MGNCVDPATAFTTLWRTTAANESITIPTAAGETYAYSVDWGDGSQNTAESGDATHTYATPGDYQVRISGTFPRIRFQQNANAERILFVTQWGNNPWTSMSSAFQGCNKLDVIASDVPDLSACHRNGQDVLRLLIHRRQLDHDDLEYQ